jgi:D-alanyl-D-alanine carboxypeptidase
MWRGARWVLVLIAAAAVAAGAALALRDEGDDRDLRPLMDEVIAGGVPGALVLVRDGDSAERWTAGLADREVGDAMANDTRFRIGSVTKTFVAAVVLGLAAEGRLGLDDPVARRLPGLPARWRAITARQLLQHTSGLPDIVGAGGLAPGPRGADRRWTPRRLLVLAASRPRVAAPGRRFSYASTNYVVLGLLVEQVTGTSLGRQLHERVFGPLRLRQTAFVVDGGAGARQAHGYVAPVHDGVVLARDGGADHTSDDASFTWAAGAIVSDAEDLARFYAALLGGRLLAPRWLQGMTRTVPAGSLRYGLGLAAHRTPCGTAWGHTGNLLGYITAVLSTRDGRRQAVVMVNSSPLAPEPATSVRRLIDVAFCGGRAGR